MISFYESARRASVSSGVRASRPPSAPTITSCRQAVEYDDFTMVDYDVAIDLLTQPTSLPSADLVSALVTSLDNVVSSTYTASSDMSIYNEFYKPSQSSGHR